MLYSKNLLTGLIGLFLFSQAYGETDISGFIEAELRLYPQQAALEQQDDAFASLASELDFYWANDSEQQSFRAKFFGRKTTADEGNRDHGDIRELYYTFAGSGRGGGGGRAGASGLGAQSEQQSTVLAPQGSKVINC